jgi:hypothetical protein
VFSSVFFSYPISTNVFSVAGVSHFHPGMDQKLAVSTFPTHELHQNIMVFNCGWKAMKNKHKGNSYNQFFLDYIIFPLVSFDSL